MVFGLLKKKPLSEDEKAHREAVRKAEQEAQWEEELIVASDRGKALAHKKKSNSLLGAIGAAAEVALVGINKGADAFNKGVGVTSLDLPKQDERIVLPKGNNNLVFD